MAISILLVDDSEAKITDISYLIRKRGNARNLITVARTANEARAHLETKRFDLLILDLALPVMHGGKVDVKAGLDLVTELGSNGSLIRPAMIVGLTAYDDLRSRMQVEFNDHGWALLRYDKTSQGWEDGLVNVLGVADPEIADAQLSGTVDVCVVTALADPELAAILATECAWEPSQLIDDKTFVSYGTLLSGKRKLKIAAVSAPRMGSVSTALVTAKMIDVFRPKLVAMTGICAGFRQQVSIGDVLVCSETWNWQSGKYEKVQGERVLAPDAHVLVSEDSICSGFAQLVADKKLLVELRAKWADAAAPYNSTLRICPLPSGSSVVADGEISEGEIRPQVSRKNGGFDMETYGLYAAVSYARRPRPLVISLKGVCDYGDEKKGDDFREFAAYLSARVLIEYLSRYGDLL